MQISAIIYKNPAIKPNHRQHVKYIERFINKGVFKYGEYK